MSGVSYCSCKHGQQNGRTGKPPKTLLVSTGHQESPTAKAGWRWQVSELPWRQRSLVSCVRITGEGHCVSTEPAAVGGGIGRVGYQTSCAGRALLQIVLPRAYPFSWNKDVRGWGQKVLPYLLVDPQEHYTWLWGLCKKALQLCSTAPLWP